MRRARYFCDIMSGRCLVQCSKRCFYRVVLALLGDLVCYGLLLGFVFGAE